MTFRIFLRTLPYVFMRVLAYLAFSAVVVVFLAIMVGIGALVASLFSDASVPLIIVAIVALAGLGGLVRLAQRYVLYLVKIGHVAVITELVTTGTLPEGVNQFAYGKDKVVRHFGSASALFGVDQLVAAAVRQILRWLGASSGCLEQIPGMRAVLSFLRLVLQIAANYVDEATMSYILTHEEQNVWQAAADGVVLYVQSWKQLLKTAVLLALLVVLVWVVGIVIFIAFMGLGETLMPDQGMQGFSVFLAFVVALLLAQVLRWLIVDPLATVAMIVSYNKAIRGQEISYDLYGQLSGVSRKFRDLTHKASAAGVPEPR